jgi:hypothetical protein
LVNLQIATFARDASAQWIEHKRMWTKAPYIHQVITQYKSPLTFYGHKMPCLSEAERNWAIGMLQAGVSAVEVSRTFNCSRNTVHELVRHFRLTGDVYDRPKSGRPRATSQQYIILTYLCHRFQPATLMTPAYNVCLQTINKSCR